MTELNSALIGTDDDGTNTTGTIIDEAYVEAIFDDIDGLIHSTDNPTTTPADIIDEVVMARGSKTTLDERLDVSINPDGTLVSSGDTDAMEAEIVAGRGSEASLDARFDTIEGRINVVLQTDGNLKEPLPKTVQHTAGIGTNSGPAPIRIRSDIAPHQNGTTVETDADSYTLTGGSLDADGDTLRYFARGFLANTANQKTLRFYFGTDVVTVLSTVTTANMYWEMEARVVRMTATTQTIYVTIKVGSTAAGGYSVTLTPVAATRTLSGNITVRTTLQSNTTTGDITQTLGQSFIE